MHAHAQEDAAPRLQPIIFLSSACAVLRVRDLQSQNVASCMLWPSGWTWIYKDDDSHVHSFYPTFTLRHIFLFLSHRAILGMRGYKRKHWAVLTYFLAFLAFAFFLGATLGAGGSSTSSSPSSSSPGSSFAPGRFLGLVLAFEAPCFAAGFAFAFTARQREMTWFRTISDFVNSHKCWRRATFWSLSSAHYPGMN